MNTKLQVLTFVISIASTVDTSTIVDTSYGALSAI